ncbi:hypothetical protein FZC68_01070 [Bacillus pumilus]|uniref:Uncharacterized protein n=1 Tax=Bacillus pumilus TaxID=1408 RepID=A0AAD0HKV9_BACPU|nr:hypothetical protein C5695_04925 [Bacillus pumilus]TYS44565.1 hypothetical protein FZC68_01070 [Bacillus pumilus]
MSGLRAGTHECQIRSVPVLVLPILQRFSITLKRRQRAKMNIILALCQQSYLILTDEVFLISASFYSLYLLIVRYLERFKFFVQLLQICDRMVLSFDPLTREIGRDCDEANDEF